MALPQKLVSFKIFTSNHFQTHVHREREREPRSRLRLQRSTNRSSTHSLRATNPRTNFSLCVILIFCVILIDPRIDLCFYVILIFYFLSLISDFFVVGVVVWVVVFWWFSCCVVVSFVWVVVKNSIFRTLLNT